MTIFLRTLRENTAAKMPSFLLILAIIFIWFLASTSFVFAQTVPRETGNATNNPNLPNNQSSNPAPPADPTRGTGNEGPNPTNPTDATQGTGNTNSTAEPPIIIGDGFLDSLYGFIVIFGGKIVGWMGYLLNWAIADFVIGFGDVYLTWGVGVAVENGWKIIRDILNISFIFGIVYIGIRLIFDADDSSAKRSLGYLLAAALLINFSLFISKFVVDFSNSLAAVIYNTGLKSASADLAASFINLLGLSTVVDNGSGTLTVGSDVSGGLAIVFGTFIFMLIAAYALAAGAFLMFVRGIALIFFMIFSPVMFLGWIFPQFKNFTNKYWSLFLSNAFMAPAYLFCIYLTFMIMHGFKYQIRTTGNGNIGGLFYAGNVNALIVFTLAIGMMLASVSIAKRMGAFGGGLVVSVGNSMRRSAQGVVGRNTLGVAANQAGKLNESLEGSRTGRGIKRALSIGTLGALNERARRDIINKGKNAKFGSSYSYADSEKLSADVANTRASEATKRSISKYAQMGGSVELENAVRGGKTEHIISALRQYKPDSSEYENIVNAMTYDQRVKLNDVKENEFSPSEKNAVSKTVTNNIIKRITDSRNSKIDSTKVPGLTFDELETLGNGWINNPENLILLTNTQVEKLAKDSKVLSTSQKAAFKDNWKRALKDKRSSKTIENAMKGRSPKEIIKLPDEYLIDVAAIPYLNESVLKEIAEDKKPQSVLNAIETNMALPGAETTGKDYLTRPTNKHRDRFW